ncbi:MAG: hypothetical protein ACP5N2_03250 [Candidatus Nanoarchaeia archaeon]
MSVKNNQNKKLIEKLQESIYSFKALEELYVDENNKIINKRGDVVKAYLVGGPHNIGRDYSFSCWKMKCVIYNNEDKSVLEDMCVLQDYVNHRHIIYEQAPDEADSFILAGENTAPGLSPLPLLVQYCKKIKKVK